MVNDRLPAGHRRACGRVAVRSNAAGTVRDRRVQSFKLSENSRHVPNAVFSRRCYTGRGEQERKGTKGDGKTEKRAGPCFSF